MTEILYRSGSTDRCSTSRARPAGSNRRLGLVALTTALILSVGAGTAAAGSPADRSLSDQDQPAHVDEPEVPDDTAIIPRSLSEEDGVIQADFSEQADLSDQGQQSAAEEPQSEQAASQDAVDDAGKWRVQLSSTPPIQVRRAVAIVREGAERTASELAGTTDSAVGAASVVAAVKPNAEKPASEESLKRSRSSDYLTKSNDALESGAQARPGDDRQVEELLLDQRASQELPLDQEMRAQQDEAVSRRILNRINPLRPLDDFVDLGRVGELAGQFLTTDGPQLVLAPYVRDPRWFEAMKLLKANQCDEAYQLATSVVGDVDASGETEPAILYAIGRIEMCTKQHATRGKRRLEALASGQYDTISKIAGMRLGRGNQREAGDADDDGVHFRQRVRQAANLALNGRVEDALHDLAALREQQTRGWNRYEVQIAEVEVLERAGRLKDAALLMQRVYRTTRNWTIGDSIQARFETLDRKAGTKLFSFGERVDRMRELIERGQYAKARKLSVENAKLRRVSGDEIRGWTLYRQAMEAEHRRKRKEAADLYAKADKLIKDPAVRPRLYFGWAKALRRLDRDPEAIALYDRICEEFKRHTLCDQALFEGGRLSQYAEQHDQARARFARVIAEYPDSPQVPTVLWGMAFSAYLMEDYAAMEPPLRRLIAEFSDLKDASELTLGLKAQYWLGVARLKAGDRNGAKNALQATISRGPLTWYGRLAVARMKSAGMNPVVFIPRSEMSLADLKNLATVQIPENPRLKVASEFARLGLYDDAIAALRQQASVYPQPTRVHEFLAAVYLANDDPANAHWLMKNHIDQSQVNYRTLRDWGVAFPVNYMEFAHKYGTEYGVSPFLVQAIIRQESGFRPGVASYAGAVGLMQLMPGTARYTQRVFLDDGGSLTRGQMVQPDTNIRLGTMYIRAQTAYAADRIPMALAGYNAGPAPLEDWFNRFGSRELDAWVESITYREARGYVRKVYTSFVTYAGLYGDEEAIPEINLQMPSELGTWGEIPELRQVAEGKPISLLH